jgi:hypothetical protein
MAEVVIINKKRPPTYCAYQWPEPLSEGTALMLTRMGLRRCSELTCWTNAPDHWTPDQIKVLLSRPQP